MKRGWSLVGFTVPALLALGVLALEGRTPVAADDGTDCEAARCAAQAAIDAACPCEDATNHGRYVRCVARAAKDNVPEECRDEVMDCAASSTCGRNGGPVICRPGASAGACEHPGKGCTSSARARVRRSARACEASGGTIEEGPSVCPPCPGGTIQCCVQSSAMGAFDTCTLVDSATCDQQGGIAAGTGTCEPNPCPPSSTTTLAPTTTTAATSSSTSQTTATTLATTSSTEATTTSTTTTTSSTTNTTFSMVGAFLDGLT
jgi:hypothetical protein